MQTRHRALTTPSQVSKQSIFTVRLRSPISFSFWVDVDVTTYLNCHIARKISTASNFCAPLTRVHDLFELNNYQCGINRPTDHIAASGADWVAAPMTDLTSDWKLNYCTTRQSCQDTRPGFLFFAPGELLVELPRAAASSAAPLSTEADRSLDHRRTNLE